MGNMLTRGGSYGAYSPAGAPIGLSPAMLEFLLIDPTIRSMIAAGGRQAPDQNQMGGLMNWAKSQAGSSRSIMPTIPGLTVPPAVQQILSQVAPLSSKTNQLANTVTGGQQVSPVTGQFVPPGATPGTQSQQQQPTSGATGQASPAFVAQIVQKAVMAALGGNSGDIAPGASTSGGTNPGSPGPIEKSGPFQDSPGGQVGGTTGGSANSGGGGFGGATGSPEGSLGGPY